MVGVITDSILFDLVALIATIIVGLIAYIKWNLTYWTRVGVPTVDPKFPWGDSVKDVKSPAEKSKYYYNYFKSRGHKHGGVYVGPRPVFVPIDPELIKHIMQLDFQHFMNHGIYINEEVDPLSGNLFNLEDSKWRHMRVKLTPTFTSGKMKMMFQTLADCTGGLKDIIDDSIAKRASVDIKDVLGRFTTDIIGSVAFGIECNSLKDPDAEFRRYGKKAFNFSTFRARMRAMAHGMVPHNLLRAIRYKFTDPEVEKFFMKAIRDTVEYREKNNVYRKDFMHLLLQLKNRGTVTDDEKIKDENGTAEAGLTLNELSAQAYVFFLAGFETSSTLSTFTLFELAANPNIQDKLREEINTILEKYDGKMTYDALMQMTYMEKVLHEALRKYPPVPTLNRVCTKDYILPNTNIKIERGTHLSIPVYALHKDPDYYPDPEKFDPERFTEENKNSRPPFTWIPFGEGPRLCIGLRFGMLQSKTGLTMLLRNYRIKVASRTKVPLVLNRSFMTSAEGGVWLDFEKLN